ncbi:MAG: hypothetical protein MJZ04_02820 [Bacteroidales bacterium]|nr:hypothetical protein [Bacteroidales bacterium]
MSGRGPSLAMGRMSEAKSRRRIPAQQGRQGYVLSSRASANTQHMLNDRICG